MITEKALELVIERGRALAADVAEETGCAPGTASTILRALYEDGKVGREMAPKTGRRGHPGYVYLRLTA